MASAEPAAEPHHAQETSSAAAAADREEAPQEPVPEAAAPGAEAEKVGEGEEEEEGECGFCLFMKAGGCKDAFVAWEECVEASEKEGSDMVERCHQATTNLKKCMDAHADYYAPVLQAEQAISDQAEAAVAAAADAAKDKGTEPASDVEKKEETVP
ncbi:uncharacterized protein LOC133891681 [Phragmites australis]|uniref:uncharacterized protein LOC133891681 n=1 Tax=Phragmites australis TaxID=29695 RepID=UPI002D7A3E06|nr:uncharacterized protein LOC133891681 [Phragmites australis]XP_062188401.1 uncharacterized protein LOC133891681 [Phragmites australis]XP_062188402.1 uncharacterized protein LOC133891681 [Phragmites australis]